MQSAQCGKSSPLASKLSLKPPQPKTKIKIMSRQLPPEGDYTAKCNGHLRVIESGKGTLGIEVPYSLNGVEFAGNMPVWIAKADGTLQTAQIDNLKQVFNWDGLDPWALCFEDPETQQKPRDYSAVEFALKDCKHEEFTPEGKSEPVTTFKPSWLNPIGGKSSFEAADRKAFMSKFGSKFRAAAGPASKTAKPSAPATKKPGPPSKPVEPCSMDDAWAALVKKYPDKQEQQQADIWWELIEKMFNKTGKDAENLSKEEYGKLRAEFAA